MRIYAYPMQATSGARWGLLPRSAMRMPVKARPDSPGRLILSLEDSDDTRWQPLR